MNQREIVSKEKVTQRIDQMVETGRQRATATIERLEQEPVKDRIVKVGQNGSSTPIEVTVDGKNRVGLLFNGDTEPNHFHSHALRQFAEKLDLLGRGSNLKNWIDGEPWQRMVVADAISTTLANTKTRERMLIRSVDNQIRGVLSDQYRRLNSVDIIASFLEAARRLQMKPYRASYDEIKWSMEMILPHPIPLQTPGGVDYLGVGMALRSSDFGASGQELAFKVVRLACINGMVGEKMLREVHLGMRLPDDITIAEDTFRHDTLRSAGMIRDAVQSVLQPQALQNRLAPLAIAAQEEIEPEAEIKGLVKAKRISKAEAEQVNAVLSRNDENEIPSGKATKWRLANALSFLGQSSEISEDRRADLEQLSGIMLGIRDKKELELVEA